jgi:hypothetical protein
VNRNFLVRLDNRRIAVNRRLPRARDIIETDGGKLLPEDFPPWAQDYARRARPPRIDDPIPVSSEIIDLETVWKLYNASGIDPEDIVASTQIKEGNFSLQHPALVESTHVGAGWSFSSLQWEYIFHNASRSERAYNLLVLIPQAQTPIQTDGQVRVYNLEALARQTQKRLTLYDLAVGVALGQSLETGRTTYLELFAPAESKTGVRGNTPFMTYYFKAR